MRRSDWCEQLWNAIADAERRPFFYGACVQLTAECIDAMTDSNLVEKIRPLYSSEAAARALIEQPGSFEKLVTEFLGDATPPLLARRGDAVLLELSTGPATGVCVGYRVACAASVGVLFLPLSQALATWRVD